MVRSRCLRIPFAHCGAAPAREAASDTAAADESPAMSATLERVASAEALLAEGHQAEAVGALRDALRASVSYAEQMVILARLRALAERAQPTVSR